MNYHERPELSSTQIADFVADPIRFWHLHVEQDWPKEPPTPAQKFGTDVHRMIELGGPDNIVVRIPDEVLNKQGHRKGKPYLDWLAEQPPGVATIKSNEINAFEIIWEHLNRNTFARHCMESGELEKEHFWKDSETGICCRMRTDCLLPTCIVDWKTARSTDVRKFQSEIYWLRYDLRLAFYQRGILDLTGETLPVAFIAIKNQPGYDVRPLNISDSWMRSAQDRLSRVMDQIASFEIERELDRDVVEIDEPRFATFDEQYELEGVAS